MFPRLLWSRFLVDLWLVREIFPLQKALLLNWCRTSFALSSALLICELLITLEENSWKQRSSDGVWANIKEECSGILESAVQGSDFKREIIYAVFWPSECLHFFPYDAIVNSVLDRRETQTGLLSDFLLVHPEKPAELPDSQATASSKIKKENGIIFFSQLVYGDVLWQH